jgi:polyferredoxin
MILCGIGMFLDKGSNDENSGSYLESDGWKRFAIVAVVIAAYVLGLYLIGFVISTPIAMLGFVAVLRSGKKVSIPASIIIAVATTAILYFVFVKLFAIPLPTGLLFS